MNLTRHPIFRGRYKKSIKKTESKICGCGKRISLTKILCSFCASEAGLKQ